MVCAKNEGRAVNQVEMASFAESRAHEKMPPKRNCVEGILDVSGYAMPARI